MLSATNGLGWCARDVIFMDFVDILIGIDLIDNDFFRPPPTLRELLLLLASPDVELESEITDVIVS